MARTSELTSLVCSVRECAVGSILISASFLLLIASVSVGLRRLVLRVVLMAYIIVASCISGIDLNVFRLWAIPADSNWAFFIGLCLFRELPIVRFTEENPVL